MSRLTVTSVAAAAIVAATAGFAPAVWAGEVGLAVSPLYFSFDLAAGDSRELQLAVHNPTAEAVVVGLEAVDFTVAPGGQTVVGAASGRSLSSWLLGPAEPFSVGAGATAAVPVLLQVPPATADGSYRAILAARTQPVGGGAVSLSGRVGAYVLVNVGDSLSKRAEVGELKVFFRGSSGHVAVDVANAGNAHFLATGQARVSGWPGRDASLELQSHVLLPGSPPAEPGSVRTLEGTWPGAPRIGLWRVTATVVDGDGTAHVVSQTVWRGLGWVAGALLIVVTVTLLTVRSVRRRHAS